MFNLIVGWWRWYLRVMAYWMGLNTNTPLQRIVGGTDYEKYTSENLIVFTILMVCTGLYSLIWLGRTSASFNDDPTTNVVMTVVTSGLWGLVLNLRYVQLKN